MERTKVDNRNNKTLKPKQVKKPQELKWDKIAINTN